MTAAQWPIPPVETPAETGDEAVKRCLDLALSAALTLVLLPAMAAIGLAVTTTSPGGALYRQPRVGRGGRLFQLYKFRTMRPAGDGPLVTGEGDERITPVGRCLRRLKLDELPQLFNVLKGEMSLVGPRPEVPRYVGHYTEAQRAVLRARPGMTGVTQLAFRNEEALLAGQADVEGFYLREVMPRKLEMDLAYLRDRSLAGDLALLGKTLAVLWHPRAVVSPTSRPAGSGGD